MQGLNLYSKCEKYFDFNDEVKSLHIAFKDIVDEIKPKSLLDIGCGQGAFLQTLDSPNLSTLGIDLSSSQIEICKQKKINAKCINLYDLDETFECITATFDVINCISKKEIKNFFEHTFKSLKKDGYFIFDVNTLYGFEDVAQGSLSIEVDDKFIAIDALYENETLETKFTVFTKDNDLYKKENGIVKQFYHSRDFLTKQLQNSRFEIETVFEFKLHDVEEPDKKIFICKAKS